MRFAMLALLAIGCGGPSSPAAAVAPETSGAAPSPAPQEPAPVSADLPAQDTPYTAEQLRAACPVGRRDRSRHEEGDRVFFTEIEFIHADEATVRFEARTFDQDGQLTDRIRSRESTWDELRRHALLPAERTVVGVESIEVPAGRYDTWRYAVSQDGDRVETYWFARDLPGPPVRHVVTEGGRTVSTTELVETSR